MNFAQNIIIYYNGERNEAILLTILGLVLTSVSIFIWQHPGKNQMMNGFFYPIVFLALSTLILGGFGVYNNTQRLERLPSLYSTNHNEFVKNEINRFEGPYGVNKWWVPLNIIWTLLLITGIVVSFATKKDLVNGIAIGLIFIGSIGFIIDGFAHQRAKIYTAELTKQ